MAKLQCARLTKFIIPSVTDKPTESRKSSIPYANPSNRTPTNGPIIADRPPLLRPGGLGAYFFNRADIDRLDDVAGLGVDGNRAARAFPFHALGGRDQAVAVGLAAGLLQRLVDEVHAVPAADGIDVGVARVRAVVGLDERRVHRAGV